MGVVITLISFFQTYIIIITTYNEKYDNFFGKNWSFCFIFHTFVVAV